MLDVRPETATVVKGDSLETVSPEDVNIDDVVEVKVGGRVPLDGVLQNESASFNTAALTGESVPRTIRKGEEVLAGMIATDNVSRVIVTKPFGQSALARILDLCSECDREKSSCRTVYPKICSDLHTDSSRIGSINNSYAVAILIYFA